MLLIPVTRLIRPLLLLGLVLVLTGCVKGKLHRPQNIDRSEGYTVAYVEFDDHGELWQPSQLERTIDLIDNANKKGRTAVVLFVHGWHNDASKREDRKKDNNVEGFKRLLQVIHDQAKRENKMGPGDSLIGVYIGWRGRSTNAKLLKPVTFYSRRGAGLRVAGVGTTEAILRVMTAAKSNPRSAGVVIGHSFGGMIVERALMQALVGYAASSEGEIQPLADLVVLVNPASQSMDAKSMLSILERNRLKFYRIGEDGTRRESPFIVSLTSTGDSATGGLYPMALGLKGLTKGFRKYQMSDCSPVESQKVFYKKTAGHNPILHSHVVTAQPMSDDEADPGNFVVKESINPKTGEKSYSFPGSDHMFTIERLPRGFNDTPYWIMSVPPELIEGHSDIFTLNTLQLLRALMRVAGMVEGGMEERNLLIRETGIRPLGVHVLPGGELIYIERSRRFYLVGENYSKPLALSCLPPIIDPNSVIGGVAEGSRVSFITSGQEKSGKKPKLRTDMVSFDIAQASLESMEWVEFKSDVYFTAAGGRAGHGKIYLVGDGALWVADLEQKKPEPVVLSRFDEPEMLGDIELDAETDRLFGVDQENGALYMFDLRSETPVPEKIAGDLGAPAGVTFVDGGSLLVVDAAGKRVLRFDCSQGRDCSEPELFATSDRFVRPSSVTMAPDGTVWVGDLGAESIFALDAKGNVVRVLDSMQGFAE